MVKMFFLQNAPSQILRKTRGQSLLFDVDNSALSLPKLENCVQTQLWENRHWRQGVIIIDKPFLTLGWKSRAAGCIFDSSYLLLNAIFESKMVINQYLRCLFGHKKVISEILRSSFIGSLIGFNNAPMCDCVLGTSRAMQKRENKGWKWPIVLSCNVTFSFVFV